MKILWITNILFPEAESMLKSANVDLRSSGGWLTSMAEALIRNNDNIVLYVSTVSSLVNDITHLNGSKIQYYILPLGSGNYSYNKKYEDYWRIIQATINPDIVHIHGSEFTHGLAYINACGNKNVVVTIQGLVSEIAKHYMAGIDFCDFLRSISLKDVLSGHSMMSLKKTYERRGVYEIELLKKVKFVCGRTKWDKSCIMNINPYLQYFYCSELIRTEFYNGIWSFNGCDKETIFLSQAHYPLKGLHKVLEALYHVKKLYPNVHVNIAGNDICKCETLYEKLKISGYGRYINKLIKHYDLSNNYSFLGYLNADEMKDQYLKCNVFICPSSLENSPNSIAEAQMLGVPVIASDVGGIPDMIKDIRQGILYPFEDVNLLASSIINVFQNETMIDIAFMRKCARDRHCEKNVCAEILSAYKQINQSNN